MAEIDYVAAYKLYGSHGKAGAAFNLPKTTFQDRYKRQLRQQPDVKVSIPKLRIKSFKSASYEPPVSPSSPEKAIEKIVYFTDTHDDPKTDKERFKWIGHYIKHANPDHVVHGGDIADLESLCGHIPNDSYGGRFKGTIQDDFASLAEALSIFGEESGITHIDGVMGNHDWRPWFFADRNPEMFGFIQHAFTSIFTTAGWHMRPYGQRITVGGVDFIHTPFQKGSAQKPMGGETLMQRYAKRIMRDVCFGHNHMFGIYSEAKDDGSGKGVTLVNGGCSMNQGYIPSYTKGAPTGWKYGINELTVINGAIEGVNFIPMAVLQGEYEARGRV